MLEKESRIHSGGCLCGAVRYEVEGPPLVVAHCHCKDCQRGSGTGHSTGAMFPADKIRLTGQVTEFKLKSDSGSEVTRVFCPACSSPILGRNSGMEGYLTIALGTLDDSSGFEPQVVVFARSRKPWDIIPNWKPGDAV